MELVGVSVVEQLEDDCPRAGRIMKESSTAAAEKENIDIVSNEIALLSRCSKPKEAANEKTSQRKRTLGYKTCAHMDVNQRILKSRSCCRFAEWRKRAVHEYGDAALCQIR